jgi:hypothetical protein
MLAPRLAILCAGFAAAIALAAPARADAPSPLVQPPAEVRAGEVIELRWHDLPATVEELEILLSVDGGRHFALRVSPELEARERVYRWRVPNLATSDARLRIRMGTREGERETAPTRAFRIIAREDAPIERILFHEGTWWTGVGEPWTSRGVGLGSASQGWSSGAGWPETAEPPTRFDTPRAPTPLQTFASRGPARAPSLACDSRSRRPAFIPARN